MLVEACSGFYRFLYLSQKARSSLVLLAQGTVTAAVPLGWFEWMPQQLTEALPIRPDTLPEQSSYLASLCDSDPKFGMLDGNSSKLNRLMEIQKTEPSLVQVVRTICQRRCP